MALAASGGPGGQETGSALAPNYEENERTKKGAVLNATRVLGGRRQSTSGPIAVRASSAALLLLTGLAVHSSALAALAVGPAVAPLPVRRR